MADTETLYLIGIVIYIMGLILASWIESTLGIIFLIFGLCIAGCLFIREVLETSRLYR
jgi:hypothetical protein